MLLQPPKPHLLFHFDCGGGLQHPKYLSHVCAWADQRIRRSHGNRHHPPAVDQVSVTWIRNNGSPRHYYRHHRGRPHHLVFSGTRYTYFRRIGVDAAVRYTRTNVAPAFIIITIHWAWCRAHHHCSDGPLSGSESKASSTGWGYECSVSANEYWQLSISTFLDGQFSILNFRLCEGFSCIYS